MGAEYGHKIMGSACAASLPSDYVKRDELISRMLQDRNVLRLLVAPDGFGKTALACEYAQRLFACESVWFVQGSSPDFLLALDTGNTKVFVNEAQACKLIILDDLAWLHEQRAQALSKCIDAALYAGMEVISTMRPSCDCLSILQPDQLVLRADDLLVTEQECTPRQINEQDGDLRAFGKKRWGEADSILFGRAPGVIWGHGAHARRDCLAAVFAENIPSSLVKSMFAMFLFQSGNMGDLADIDIIVPPDDMAMLVRDYPVFGLDAVSGRFNIADFDLEELRHAITANRLESVVLEGNGAVSERVLGALFRRGDLHRGSLVVDSFCDDKRSAGWLLEHGWDFLDSGELDIVSALLDRCPEQTYACDETLRAMHAWLAGLSGDRREACHIARCILDRPRSDARPHVACVAARIALALFDKDAIVEMRQDTLSSEIGPQGAVDFLAGILDICSNIEIARAFCPNNPLEDSRYEKARQTPEKQRAEQMALMFTEHADAFGGSRSFRIALHILAHVDSAELRPPLQNLGCDEILRMRRHGVTTFSEAVLVRDLWQSGYFGLVGPTIDRRDAKILDGASHMLELLSRYCGCTTAYVPWEAHGAASHVLLGHVKQSSIDCDTEPMHVRLFGGFEITVGDRYLNEGKWRKKARALFALLVLNNGRDVPRDDLFSQLWPGMSRPHALDNFYTAWGNCTSAVGDNPYLERNGEYCRVDPRFVHSDIAEFEQLTRHLLTSGHDSTYLLDTYAKIEVLYRGPLMPSEKNVRAINAQRERYRALYVDAMVAAVECALHMGDARVALWFARKAMEEDQTREDVYRTLMKAQIAAGQRCPAIKTYLVCRDYLQGALGLDPSLETRELYNSLVTTDPELLRLEIAFSSKSSSSGERRR